MRTGRPRTPLIERVLAKVRVDASGCWLWLGSTNDQGYGVITLGGRHWRKVRVHRAVYEHFVDAIPEGLTLDHLCRVRNCVNPDHVEPVTRGENVLRGLTTSGENARKTHCINGHEFAPGNTYRRPGGKRECRICLLARSRRRFGKASQEAVA